MRLEVLRLSSTIAAVKEEMNEHIRKKNLLILASAGSGKTYQLANRIIGLVAMGVPPESIVALTFTRKAAGEFADAVLGRLAEAATDDKAADRLRKDLGLPDADFPLALEKVVRALPSLTLATMDSFFSKVVRCFQYELGLTGGRFQLLEEGRAQNVADEMLNELLGESLDEEMAGAFMHAFRRAFHGREKQGVNRELREFVREWQGRFRNGGRFVWGPDELASASIEDWELEKEKLGAIAGGFGNLESYRSGTTEAMEAAVDMLKNHVIGSGSLSEMKALLKGIFAAWDAMSGPLELSYYRKRIEFEPAVANALRRLAWLASQGETHAAIERTRAIRELVSTYDSACEQKLRRRGLLGFDDVKLLMGAWTQSEEGRLSREAVDFRLGASYQHWLLDEFQDTSRSDWTGLVPLLDEAAGEGEGTVFIVGDRKQAIYAWRGGEVSLFDEVMQRFDGLETAPMAESWRSSPEVLDLVNRVCGDPATIADVFGETGEWQYDTHVSAPKLADPAKRGEARVEVLGGKWESHLERLASLLTELGVGERPLSCGVLVNTNAQVKTVGEFLRDHDFDVIEEGTREPGEDNFNGILLVQLLEWLANPDNGYARRTLEMSPLMENLTVLGESWERRWETLLGVASNEGFSAMATQVVAPHWERWSVFGRRRAGDVLSALANFDAQGGSSAREAAEWIKRLKISQSPGTAAVQVMTIHKSKGLGFDVVILPHLSDDKIPSSQYFKVAEGDDWYLSAPPQWARPWVREVREAEERWEARQRYERFCTLYVALTRAKRGLYVLLPALAKDGDPDKPSFANWVSGALDIERKERQRRQFGESDWIETLPLETKAQTPSRELPVLQPATARRDRTTPSSSKQPFIATAAMDAAGREYGTAVHLAFEGVGWIDEATPQLPENDAGARVGRLIAMPSLRDVFERRGREVELFREQPVDAIVDERWLTGIVDRLHVHREKGKVTRVEVIDFKTDAVDDLTTLATRYRGQMEAYRQVMERAYPGANVECSLVSTRHAARIAV